MLKKILSVLMVCISVIYSFPVFSNQRITKVGVIDMDRVKLTFINKSRDYSNYEKFKKEFDDKVAALTAKIDKLQLQRLEAKEKGNDAQVLKLESDIQTENDYLKEYYQFAKTKVKTILQEISSGDEFYLKLKRAIAMVAEEDGYSVVLDIASNPIFYWAADIDVTDKVIKYLAKMFETK